MTFGEKLQKLKEETEKEYGVTAEIFVNIIDGKMNRRVHPVTGINIFDI